MSALFGLVLGALAGRRAMRNLGVRLRQTKKPTKSTCFIQCKVIAHPVNGIGQARQGLFARRTGGSNYAKGDGHTEYAGPLARLRARSQDKRRNARLPTVTLCGIQTRHRWPS